MHLTQPERVAQATARSSYYKRDWPLGILEIGAIEWWLDWFISENNSDSRYMLQDRMSWLFATYLSREARQAFVIEFNKSGSKYRVLLTHSILLHQTDLTTDDFSSDAVSYLLADLGRVDISNLWRGHLLGQTATEKFVAERLLPLVPEAKRSAIEES